MSSRAKLPSTPAWNFSNKCNYYDSISEMQNALERANELINLLTNELYKNYSNKGLY